MTALSTRRAVQNLLGVAADGIIGPKSRAAFDSLASLPADALWPPVDDWTTHSVLASSFADPEDVAAFRACKATGKSDVECYRVGDSGIGEWGDDTTVDIPMCALPPEDWEAYSNARGKKVLVTCGDKSVVCELRDTMPHKAAIKNGAGIDLNEAAWKSLGHSPPQLRQATWKWA